MKKALSFAVSLGLVAGMVVGCSTLSDKGQQNVEDAIALFQCIDGVVIERVAGEAE